MGNTARKERIRQINVFKCRFADYDSKHAYQFTKDLKEENELNIIHELTERYSVQWDVTVKLSKSFRNIEVYENKMRKEENISGVDEKFDFSRSYSEFDKYDKIYNEMGRTVEFTYELIHDFNHVYESNEDEIDNRTYCCNSMQKCIEDMKNARDVYERSIRSTRYELFEN